MKWYLQHRFLETFLAVLGVCLLSTGWFLFSVKSDFNEASARFRNSTAELNRLERRVPYPSSENLRTMKLHAEDYERALGRLKEQVRRRTLPVSPMKPSDFQTRLRVAVAAVVEKARAHKVKLPENFYLGFDEFAASLPNEIAAPLLGQELVQIEWFLNNLVDARVEAVTVFHRSPLPEEPAKVLAGSPAGGAPRSAGTSPAGATLIERNVVEATFIASPAAAGRVINQLAGASDQFCVIRRLQMRNEKQKGPAREAGIETSTAVRPPPVGSAPRENSIEKALNFIVGEERIEATAQIEFLRFLF